MNNTFETTWSCTLVVIWNYYVDHQTIQTGSKTTVTSKMDYTYWTIKPPCWAAITAAPISTNLCNVEHLKMSVIFTYYTISFHLVPFVKFTSRKIFQFSGLDSFFLTKKWKEMDWCIYHVFPKTTSNSQ